MTLFSMLVVVVIVGILAGFAAMRINTTGENTLAYQAQRMARDIRHLQTLGSTWGRALTLTTVAGANGSYKVTCTDTTLVTPPCNGANPVTDPVTGADFNVSLEHNVSLSPGGSIKFDSQGRPLNAAGTAFTTASTTYTLTAGSFTATVAVRPITGFVAVAP